jgi:inosose dehydratase
MRTDEGRDLTERRMRCAREWFDVALVVSNAGQPTTPKERAAVVSHLRRLGDVAAELDMTLSLETHKGPTQNAAAMQALMHDVHHDRVGINFDTGNIAYYNHDADPVHELALALPVVRSMHLKDNRGGFEDWYFPAIGDGGGVDFVRLRQVLEAAHYAGDFTIEIEGIGGEPEPGIEIRHERVKRSAAFLRRAGYPVT